MESSLKHRITKCVEEIGGILKPLAYEPHSSYFESILQRINNGEDMNSIVESILKIYRGAGSFNDLVLSSPGNFYRQENLDLDNLRIELHRLCVEYVEASL